MTEEGNSNVDYWHLENTSNWEGFALEDAWWIEKSLEDYITNPADQGTAATVHPDANNGTACTTGASESPTNGDYYTDFSGGFTMEFDYYFDTSRGDGIYGWVQAIAGGTPRNKLSFIGNSGVKFGGVEAAIFDVKSMVDRVGGLSKFQQTEPYQNGVKYGTNDLSNTEVDVRIQYDSDGDGDIDANDGNYEIEHLSQLMAGIEYDETDYGTIYDFTKGNPSTPYTWQHFYAALVENYNRTNSSMKIDVTQNGSLYTLAIFLDGSTTASYEKSGITLSSLNTLYLQSHWGSGVVFSDLNIIKK